MKSLHIFLLTGLIAALSLAALPAQAQNVATFQGSTLGFSKNGDFNAFGSSCADGSTPTFRWTFVEDGVIRFGNPVTHRFTTSFCAYTVTLDIFCADGTTASLTRFVCFGCGVFGCIRPDRGYN